MKVLVVGGGGREHAIIRKLKESPRRPALYAAPGNGGIASDAVCVPIAATDVAGVVSFAVQEGIDYVVVAPDDPLVLGMVDALAEKGIPAFGPNKAAAILEGSKVFSKNLMKKYGIPTAAYETFADAGEAAAYVRANRKYPLVVKADGLALGKGVLICEDEAAALAAVKSIMEDRQFGASGSRIVIEEFLTGPEVSVLSFTDGKTVVPMVSSMDHKRALDGDRGLNTGGMGTIAPNPYYTPQIAQRVHGDDFQAHRCGHERGGPALQRLSVFRADAYARRPEGHRVQLPFRRPGDPGGAAASGERPAGCDAGRHQRYAGADGSKIQRPKRRVRGAGFRRIPAAL